MVSDHGAQKRPRSFSESLHIFTSPNIIPGAPSPTRIVGKVSETNATVRKSSLLNCLTTKY